MGRSCGGLVVNVVLTIVCVGNCLGQPGSFDIQGGGELINHGGGEGGVRVQAMISMSADFAKVAGNDELRTLAAELSPLEPSKSAKSRLDLASKAFKYATAKAVEISKKKLNLETRLGHFRFQFRGAEGEL